MHSIAIDESLPETLRSRALAVAADYPAPEVIEQVRREGNRGLEPSAVGASCNARRLLNDVARTKDFLDPRRREVQGTSVVVVRVLDHLVVAGPLRQTSCRLPFSRGSSAAERPNMQKNQHSPEFIEQALSKARARGTRTLESVATELSMSLGTLKGWLKRSRSVGATRLQPSGPLFSGCWP